MKPLFVTTRKGSMLKTKFRDLETSDALNEPLWEYTRLFYTAVIESLKQHSAADRAAFLDYLNS